MCVLQKFSLSVANLLIYLTLFFTEQMFLIFMKSNLSIISFMKHAFCAIEFSFYYYFLVVFKDILEKLLCHVYMYYEWHFS